MGIWASLFGNENIIKKAADGIYNDVRELTVAEMQECLLSGIAQGKVIWKTYTDALKQL